MNLLTTPTGEAFSYADMETESARIAGLLARLGLGPGDRVTVQVAKSPAAVWLYLACRRGGYVFHPLNDAYRGEEIAFLLADAKPALAVCDPQRKALFRELLPHGCRLLTLDAHGHGSLADAAGKSSPQPEVARRAADEPAILLYTSGTTGRPKGAIISHGNLASNVAALIETWEFTASDRLLHALPLYHAHGLFVGLGCTLASGASMLFLPKFDPAAVVAALPDCTVMMGVPTYYARLLREPGLDREACRNMRLFISGSAPLSPEVFAAFRKRTGHAILERYGMTETGMLTSNPLRGERRPGSVGLPLPGVALRVVGPDGSVRRPGEIGAVEVSGANVFSGYWQQAGKTAEAFTPDGYFRTGDQGYISADGYLTLSGRSTDLIITGGLNVYPREVELLLDGLQGVAESAVVGVPHPDFGEAVVAAVVAEPGTAPAEAGIIAAMKERLAGFKVPKRVFMVNDLPRNSMGKVEKTVLRARYRDTFADRP
ncbi:MAG: AMP-binding protein [Gammaproteobacteria bacterium]|nr:AMP-binding protein [Gammaproteobacteria bacterium]